MMTINVMFYECRSRGLNIATLENFDARDIDIFFPL